MLSISLQTPEVWTFVCLLLENLLYFLFYWEKRMRWERQNNEITAVNGPLCAPACLCMCVFPTNVSYHSDWYQLYKPETWETSLMFLLHSHRNQSPSPINSPKYFSICPPMKRLPGPQTRFLPVSRRTLYRPLKYSSQLAIRLWLGSFH